MLLAAFLDAGLELHDLEADLSSLGLSGYELRLTRALRQGIAGCQFVVVDLATERPLRALRDIRQLIEASALPLEVSEPSLRVFQRLAEAEAQVHGTSVEDVHFHEVGALDTLVDVVGFCCALHRLGVEALYSSALPLGSGAVLTEHGLLPVPAPATLALLAVAGAPVMASPSRDLQAKGELVTPTGAALLSTLATFSRPALRVQRVGYGLGSKEFPWPNLLRVWIGDADDGSQGKDRKKWAVEGGHEHAHPHDHAHQHTHGVEH